MIEEKVQAEARPITKEDWARNQYQIVRCCWSSFGPLKRHFEANNKDIRVISIW